LKSINHRQTHQHSKLRSHLWFRFHQGIIYQLRLLFQLFSVNCINHKQTHQHSKFRSQLWLCFVLDIIYQLPMLYLLRYNLLGNLNIEYYQY
jgi:hypothetical protein